MSKVFYTTKEFDPTYGSEGAAGFDLRAYFENKGAFTLEPNKRVLVKTGINMEIPQGFEVQIRPRSGLSLKHGIMLVNSPGTIDEDYRGDVGVLLYNSSDVPFVIEHGDRIAQGVLAPVTRASFIKTDKLSETERGTGGYGSTGVK